MTNDELDVLMISCGLKFGHPFARSHLVAFAKRIEEREREACAKVCMSLCSVIEEPHEFERCAAAIRARGEK